MGKADVVKLDQWRARAGLSSSAVAQGWDVTNLNLDSISDPACYYICEPLLENFNLMGTFDYPQLKRLVNEGLEPGFSIDEIGQTAAALTLDYTKVRYANSKEKLESVILANVINFASTQTAKAAVGSNERYRHFGTVLYLNPYEPDNIILRPVAISNEKDVLRPADVAMAISQYIIADHKNHPEFFLGRELEDVLGSFLRAYPRVLEELDLE